MSVASSGYCHITGLTKAMPKSNFIPMMPVLSQKEQAQLYGCRITMCSYMDHNFVPIIEFGKGKGIGVDSCRVTGHQSVSIKRKIPLPEESDNEMKRVYRFRNDHRYMEPFLSRLANPGEKAVMEELLDRMRNTTKMDSSNFFVYALNDKRTGKTGLVLPFEYEEGIRTGVIEHIMLSGDSNKLVVRIRDGPICTIPMDKITKKQIECLSDDAMLFDGRGPNRDILEAQRRDKAAREHDDRDQMAMYLAEMERKRYEREERNKEKMKERIKLKMAEAEESERRQKVCDEEIRKQYEEAVRIRAEAEAQRAAALEVRLAAREQREAEARAARAEELALEAEEKIRQQEEMRLAEKEAERRQQEAAASALADIVPQDMSVNELLDHMRDHAGDSDILQCMEEAADTGMSSTEIVNLVSKSAVEAIEEQFADSSEGHSSHQESDISDEYSDDEELMCSLSAEQGARQVFQQTTGRTLSINREDKEGECDENIVAGGNQTSKKTFSDDENVCLKDITGDALVLRKDQIHSEQVDNAVQTQSEQPEELNVEEEQWMKELEELRIQEMERKRLEREKKKLERQKKKEEQELKDEEKRIAKEAKEKKKQEMYERMAAIRKADAADDAKLLEEPEKKEMPTIEIKRRYKPEQQTENTEEDPTVIVKPEKADQLFAEEDLPSVAKIPSNTRKLSEESEKNDQLPTEEDPTSATLQQQCNITANIRKLSEESVKRLESESEGDTPEEFLVQARDGRMVATRSELDDSCIVEGRISLDDSTGAPKVTPGRMIHVDKGTEFIAGKVVATRDGEEFVPGKDVRTTEGIKFVPGQSVGTDKGMQFFPGMTFSDGDKVEFVPGHVVNMDADEVFVPGQVVSTDKDSVFVPGSVYHSNAGPLFVPGVVQNREFLPGQVIETENGPRYVATSVTANPSAERKGKAAIAGADKMPPSAIGPSWSERRSRKIAPVIIDPADLPPMQPVSRYANMTLDDGPLFLEPNPNRPRKVFEEPEYYSRYLHEMKKNQEEAKSKVMDEEPEESFSYMVQSFDLDPNELELCRKLEHSAPLAPCFEGLKIQDSARLMQLAARAYRAKVIPQAISLPSPPKSKRQVYENVRVTFLDCVDRATRALATTADKLLKKEFLGQQAKRMQRILADDVNNPLPIADVTAFLRLCCSLPNAVFEVGQWIDGLFGHSDRGVFRPLECLVHRKLSRKVSLLKVLTGVVLSADSEAEAAGQKDAVLQSLVAILQKEMPRRTHVDDHREKTQEMISAIILTAGKVVLNDIFNSVAYGDELFVGSVLSGVKESIQELACDPDAVVTLEQGIVSYVQDITKRRLLCLLEYSRQPESLQREGLSYHVVVHEALGLALLEDDLETAECLRLCLATPGLVGLLPLHQRAWEYVGTAVTLHALADGDEARQRLLHDLAKYPNVLRKNDQWLRFLSGARVVVQFGSGLRSQRLNTAADITDEVISLVAQSCSEDVERLFHAVMLEAARNVYALEAAGSGRGGPPVVVLKHQFEGIVPRDQARDVINGRVEYLLVDETGVRFFRVGELDGRRLERMERASQWADAVANGVGCLPGQDPAKARKTSALKRQEHELYGSELLDQERIMDSTGLYHQLETTRDASNKRVKLEGGLDLNLSSEGLLDNSAAKHKISIRPSRRHADSRHSDSRSGYRPEDKPWSPDLPANSGVVLSQLSAAESQHLLDQRGAVVRELLETEEEFVRDTQFILENYYRHLDSAQMPRALRDQKEPLFANFPLLCDFHCRELLEGIKYYADNPLMIGKTFLRLAPEFEKHAIYCRDEPEMQALLQNNQQLREYFQEYSQRLNDEKSLSEHLRLPIQRINDYQLLLKDLVHLSSALGEDCTDLERALEFILGIPQRSRDLQYINSIQGYRGCLQRLGRLLKHDWFAETESDGKSRQRYLFLFKSRILICKPNKISDTKSVFILKRIVQLSGVTFSESLEDDSSFSLHLKPVDSAPYPIHLRCRSPEARHCWLQQLHELAEQQALCPEPASAVGEEDLVIDSALCDEADEEFFTASHDAFPKDPLSVSTGISSSGLSAAGPTRPLRHSVADPTGHVISHSEADPGNAQRIGGTAQVHRPTRHSVATAPQSAAAVSIETSQQQSAEPCVTPTPVAMEMEAPNPQPDGTDSHPSHIPEVDESIPRFVEKIKGFNCEPGEKAVFECRVEADPPAVVTWLRNNRPMDDRLADRVMISSDMDRHTLKVLNCTVEDSGLICAKAVNNCGDSVCSAMLDVQQLTEEDRRERRRQLAPQFSIHLKNTEILERAAVVFMVKAEGNPQPTIEFFKDGGPLTLTDRVTVTRDPSGSHELYIHHVVPEDAGLYRCVATNDKGREECEGQITVTDDEAVVFSLLDKKKVLDEAASSNFAWFKDGEEFDPAERFKVLFKDEEDTLALVFQHVTPEDAGMYTCVAATESGRISCSAELTVQGGVKQLPSEPEAPCVVEPLQNTEVSLGGSAMLECKMRGYPAVNVTWSLNGEEIKSGERFKVLYEDCESMALIIKSVVETDSGKVCLVARNNLGECVSEASLIVKSCPRLLRPLSDVAIMCDEPVRMEAEIAGTPAPDVKWYKDGQRVMESDRVRFMQETDTKFVMLIDRMTLQDAGSYSIVASNSMGQLSEFWKVSGQAPPKFIKQLFRETVKNEQENAVLEVKVQGSPVPVVKWFKDGSELTIDGRHYTVENDGHIYALTINGVAREDTAEYVCRVSNEFGKDQTSSQLHVRCSPEVEQGLQDRDVYEKEPFVLEVKVSGYPEPMIRWFIGEMEITEEHKRYKKERAGKFIRLKVESADSEIIGQYRCTLKNELGSCETSAFINVLKSPEFVEPLKDLGWDENKSLTLQVQILAVPDPEVKWYHEGEEIKGSSGDMTVSQDGEFHSLHFSTLKEVHQGSIRVQASNSQGENSSTMFLTVYTKPQILTKFTDLICFITENKILTVQGYGNPIPEPHWHMDGAEIHSSEDYVIQQDKHQYRLIIPRVRYEDAGQYKLALKNHMGQAEEQCKLVVKPLSELKEPHFFTHIFDDTKKKGDEVTLSMEIRGNPQPDIKWFKDDVELAPDTNIMMTYDLESCVYTLKIRRISDGDMGTYVCRATNEYGTEQEQARIDVIFKPEISGLREIPVVPGEGATLHATIKSNPKCRLKWQHDQKDLKSSHNVIITTNEENTETSVQILTVGMYDGGIYSVVAENTQGETISNGLILLRTALPTFKKRLLNTGARLGDRLRLEAVITGLPVPDVSWFKEDAPLQVERIDEDTYRFMVDEVTSPDYGQYRIVAMNCVGSSECCCDVTEVVLPPVIETRLPTFHKMDEAETLVLEVKTDGNPPPEVCWMLDNEPLQLSDRVRAVQLQDGVCQLTVEDLRPEDAGRYRLVASNGNGDAATETAVTVDRVLSKPRFENILDDVEVTAGRPLKLETRVLGYPKPGVKWLKNGVPLHSSEHISITNTPQGTSILDIENATLEDSGAYSVIAVNDLGEESLDADVVVEPARKKPCLLEALTAVRAVEGYPPRVEGRFSGVPAPLVSWFRDGEPVDLGSSRAKPYTLPDGTFGLLLPCCEQEDSGVYKACVANLVGRLQTETKLDVIAKQRPGPEMAPQFSSTLRDTEVNEGSQLLLTAEVTGNPLPDVCWSKDNVPLDTGDERVFTGYDGDKVTLSVRPSRVRDAGRYHVVLSSKLGQADASCVVRVKKTYQAPHFAQKVTDIQQVPGFDGKFLGRVSGTPRPDVEWLCNDMPIEASSKKYRIKRDADMCGLHVIDCEMRDAGIYTCVARNVDGEARCSAHLDVVEKIERRVRSEAPFFLKTIAPCEVFPGMQGKFTACVAGSPEPQYEWYKNDVIILPSDRVLMETDGCGLIRLVIKHADDADSGRYRLKIYNTHGDAACEADLFYDTLDGGFGFGSRDHNQTVDRQMRTGIPVPLCDRPLISRMNDRQLTLSWHPSPTAGHHMPVTYHVEMAEMPRGDWFSVRTGVRGCSVEVRNLEPHRDYRFRVKVENKHGTSDASPYVVTQRERFVPEGGSAFSYLPDGEVFKSDLSSHFPRDFDMDKWSAGRGCPPTFLPHPSLTQYGVRGHSESLHWLLYGSPKPDVSFTYNGKPLELGGRYCCSYPSNGECTLFINKLQDRDQGYYELLARNPHGEIRQRVNLQMARHPYFLQSPTPVCALQHEEVRLVARAAGMPAPTLRWFRDWLPLVPSDRVRVVSPQEDTSILLLHSCVARDAGLYTVTATNAAGTATTSAYLRVEQDEALYSYLSYSPSRCIRPKSRAFEDFYLIGDELGRGTQGVIYHVSERGRGGNFAAKCMSGTGELRQMMSAEMWAMGQLCDRRLARLYDAYQSDSQLVLVQELCSGGELLETMCRRDVYTEVDVAGVIRQVLLGLRHMHGKHIGHLGLTPGDILFSRPAGSDIQITDFSLSRHINPHRPERLAYGMPEFVAPEIVNNEVVGLPADMWSVGIITYLLLSGISPFRGETDRETLKKIQSGEMSYDLESFRGISDEAKDFISRMLVFSAEGRLDVEAALKHPWMSFADRSSEGLHEISTTRLGLYLDTYRSWYRNTLCRTWFRRRPLASAFTHPSCMVYPPDGEVYTPPLSQRHVSGASNKSQRRRHHGSCHGDETDAKRHHSGDDEIGWVQTESHYQQGPETYLLQLRDTGLPSRLRRYMKVARERSALYSRKSSEDPLFDRTLPMIHERRRFTDIMDEEIDDERRRRIGGYDVDRHVPRRLRYEMASNGTVLLEPQHTTGPRRSGAFPFFREKPSDVSYREGDVCKMSCLAVGTPKPIIQWFRNDLVIGDSRRIRVEEEESGRSSITFEPAKNFDQGVYKVVARNSTGQAVAKCRLFVGSVPGLVEIPEPVEHTDTEVLLRWRMPQDSGHPPVVAYSLQMKHLADHEWIEVADNIDHEFFVVHGLEPESTYHFRLRARNQLGWGQYNTPSPIVHMHKAGWSQKIQVSKAEKYQQRVTESGRVPPELSVSRPIDYTTEDEPIPAQHVSPELKYNFLSEISRGRFSVVAECLENSTQTVRAAKILQISDETREAAAAEMKMLSSLRHERIATLFEFYDLGTRCVLILERLQGLDVLNYFQLRHEYNEDMVVIVISQVLDALQYLHWRGIAHLNLQPDNIVLTSCRRPDVKLVDLGSARRIRHVTGADSPAPPCAAITGSYLEFAAPELICGESEAIGGSADVWSLGAITYLLLSGVSPFLAASDAETRLNILHVHFRYEHLYPEITTEATRFVMFIFKRAAGKRPSCEECEEHRWMMSNEYMQKQRQRAVFLGNRLREYSERYHGSRQELATQDTTLTSCLGMDLSKSLSVENSEYTTV